MKPANAWLMPLASAVLSVTLNVTPRGWPASLVGLGDAANFLVWGVAWLAMLVWLSAVWADVARLIVIGEMARRDRSRRKGER